MASASFFTQTLHSFRIPTYSSCLGSLSSHQYIWRTFFRNSAIKKSVQVISGEFFFGQKKFYDSNLRNNRHIKIYFQFARNFENTELKNLDIQPKINRNKFNSLGCREHLTFNRRLKDMVLFTNFKMFFIFKKERKKSWHNRFAFSKIKKTVRNSKFKYTVYIHIFVFKKNILSS